MNPILHAVLFYGLAAGVLLFMYGLLIWALYDRAWYSYWEAFWRGLQFLVVVFGGLSGFGVLLYTLGWLILNA